MSLEMNHHRVFKAGESEGSSGSFFFFSYDNKFIVKTINSGEKKVLLSILDDLTQHLNNSKSLISRIYGIFNVKSNVFGPVEIILMQNVIKLCDNKCKKLTFDLKGSTFNRNVQTEPHFWKKQGFNSKKVLKD